MGYGHRRLARDCLHPERLDNYFVPSYAIRRRVSPEDPEVRALLKRMRKILGRHFTVCPVDDLGLTVVERGRFVECMREARVRPSSRDVLNMAHNTRDGLAEIDRALDHRDLELPIGRLARFGQGDRKNTTLGVVPLGWRGPRARYPMRDQMDQPLPLGTTVAESNLGVGVITQALTDATHFRPEVLTAGTPHVSLAFNPGGIRDHQFRAIEEELADELPPTILLEAPVVYIRTERGAPIEPIYVREPGVLTSV